jgi:ubiquinone/menaquinone biosynthesis C-methylase UbiE
MLDKFYTIMTSNNPNLFFLRWVLIIATITVLVFFSNKIYSRNNQDGFTQSEPFVYKYGNDSIDSFYVDIYDSLHETKTRSRDELIKFIEMTEPSVQHSNILDVGSGTGYIVNELTHAGYDVYGIDKSKEMLTYAQTNYPDAEYVYGDVLNSMQFEKSTFTHILCTYFTIYQLEDKKKFFRNCYFWMKPNSYLMLHLVDTDKFTKVIPAADENAVSQRVNNNRIITSNTIFSDYKYKCSYDIPDDNNNLSVELKETFIDTETDHVRQNESHLYMEKMDTILNLASENGFILQGQVDMKSSNGDENQYLYILERSL